MDIYVAFILIVGLILVFYWVSSEVYRLMHKKNISKTMIITIIIVLVGGIGLGFMWLIQTWLEGIPSV